MGAKQSADRTFTPPIQSNMRLTEDLVNTLYRNNTQSGPTPGINQEELRIRLLQAKEEGFRAGLEYKERELVQEQHQKRSVETAKLLETEKAEVKRVDRKVQDVTIVQKSFQKPLDSVSKEKRNAVIACYQENKTTPLNCSSLVKEFSESVRKSNKNLVIKTEGV